jgi:predicted phage terminase large subunit-like protein
MSIDLYEQAIKDMLRERCETSLLEFVRAFWHVVDSSKFNENWHVIAICECLQAVSDGRIKRLMIQLPPRHAKSIIAKVFYPVWDWLRTPSRRFLTACVDESLARGFSGRSMRLIDSDLFQTLWGGKIKKAKTWRESHYLNTSKGHRMIMTTAGGTGKDGDILICDDPIQATKVAYPSERRRVWTWFTGTFKMRVVGQGAIVLIMQRLHEEDVVGNILKDPEEAKEWSILCLPAQYESKHPVGCKIALPFPKGLYPQYPNATSWEPRTEEGEVLWQEMFGIDWIKGHARTLGAQEASAQLQQRPSPAKGQIFTQEMFPESPYTAQELRVNAREIVISIDCAFKATADSDYVAMLVFARNDDGWHCAGGINRRMSFIETLEATKALVKEWNPDRLLIESAANGPALISSLKREAFNNIIAIKPKDPKQTRAMASAVIMGDKLLHFAKTPATDALIEQAKIFPNSMNDDLVDAMTQFVNYYLNKVRPATHRKAEYYT